MKRSLYLLAAGLIVLLPQTSSAQTNAATANITAGRNQLKQQTPAGLAQADSFFAKAITNNSSNLEANLLKAATSLLLEQNSAQFQAQLTGVGVTINNNDIYNFLYTPPVDADGFDNPTPGVTTSSTLTYIKSKIPLIDAALANLGKFGNATTSSFAISLSESETATANVRIDYGDVLMLRALLKGAKAFIALMSSYNTAAEYAKIAYLEKNFNQYGKITPQLILETFPDLMKLSTSDQRATAKALIVAANADFQIAHNFILARPYQDPSLAPHLFEYGDSEQAGEQAEQFNAVVASLNAGSDLPIPNSGITINPAKFFSSTIAPRSFITSNSSAFDYGYPIRSSWPDPTFGGVIKSGAASLLDSLEDGFKDIRVEQRLWRMAERPTRKGTIKAWGSNASAQTAVPAGLTNVVQVAAGGNHTIALKADGSVAVWGSNQYGQSALPPLVTTLAGSGDYGSANGQGTAASFAYPQGVAVDGGGNIYVADTDSHRVRKITANGSVTTLAGSGSWGSTNGQGAAASFDEPTGVAVDGGGNIYVADTDSHRVRKITANGSVTTLAGSGSSGSTNGQGVAASFAYPTGVAVDGSGNVYVADSNNNKIRKITANGTVSTLAGSGSWGSGDGQGTTASFAYPTGVAVDGSGNVYVADSHNNKIRKITANGTVTTLAGSGGFGSADGQRETASFNYPEKLAVDSSGNVYVANYSNIRKITASGAVTTIPGSGSSEAICIDKNGNIYTASNNKILKFNPSITGLADVNQISAGENHSLALKSDGAVFGWGSNAYNQLSFDPYYWLDSPAVQVSAGGDIPWHWIRKATFLLGAITLMVKPHGEVCAI